MAANSGIPNKNVKIRVVVPTRPALNKSPIFKPMQSVVFKKPLIASAIKTNGIKVQKPVKLVSPNKNNQTNSGISNIHNTKIGRILVIIGCGPSRAEAGLERLAGTDVDTMSINEPYEPLWPTTSWMFCDNTKLRLLRDKWIQYSGLLINSTAIRERKESTIAIDTLAGYGFSQDLARGMFMGRSTVFTGMQVAHWMGYDTVYIFGVDMCAPHGKLYEWGSNPDVDDKTRIKRFESEAKFFEWAADNVDRKITSKYAFCSAYNPFPFVEKYRKLDHRIAVDEIFEKLESIKQK